MFCPARCSCLGSAAMVKRRKRGDTTRQGPPDKQQRTLQDVWAASSARPGVEEAESAHLSETSELQTASSARPGPGEAGAAQSAELASSGRWSAAAAGAAEELRTGASSRSSAEPALDPVPLQREELAPRGGPHFSPSAPVAAGSREYQQHEVMASKICAIYGPILAKARTLQVDCDSFEAERARAEAVFSKAEGVLRGYRQRLDLEKSATHVLDDAKRLEKVMRQIDRGNKKTAVVRDGV